VIELQSWYAFPSACWFNTSAPHPHHDITQVLLNSILDETELDNNYVCFSRIVDGPLVPQQSVFVVAWRSLLLGNFFISEKALRYRVHDDFGEEGKL
jgi:hypothetical protein